MDSIFSYESKFVQMLTQLADLVFLNVLYVFCCIPLFTIGAAQAALHSGIQQMLNKEDDRSCFKAFFRGFRSGFGKITLLHTLLLIIIAVLIWATGIAAIISGNTLSTWLCVLAVCVAALYHSMLTFFHSYFDCTPYLLLKNVLLIILAHPLRSLVVAVLVWFPLGVLMLNAYLFLQGFPLWALLYYGVAFLFCHSIMKKPFNEIKERFLSAQTGVTEAE